MRLFFAKLLLLLPILAILVLTNWRVDPGYLYHNARGDVEGKILDIFQAGKNVEVFNLNYNERRLQKLNAGRISAPLDVLVLGSSRSMQIHSSLLTDGSFFNASISGAMLQDYVAIYELYYEAGMVPGEVIIEISPWIFNRNAGEVKWRSLQEEYYRAVERMKLGVEDERQSARGSRLRKSLEVFSPSYFQASLKLRFLTGTKGSEIIRATDEVKSGYGILFPDGSREYGARERKRTLAEVRRMAILYVKNAHIYELGSFERLDPGYMRLLESFVDEMQSDGVDVRFYLPPYHPAAYELLLADTRYRLVDDVEKYIRRLADEEGCLVYASYDPGLCGLEESDFVDAMHLSRVSFLKIFKPSSQ